MSKTYEGLDGELRDLGGHRSHLQRELDQAVDTTSPRFDEGFASRLRAQLGALPSSREVVERAVRHAAKAEPPKPPAKLRLALVFEDADSIATIQEYFAAGPDAAHEILASSRKKLKASCLLRRVLKAILTAKVER